MFFDSSILYRSLPEVKPKILIFALCQTKNAYFEKKNFSIFSDTEIQFIFI